MTDWLKAVPHVLDKADNAISKWFSDKTDMAMSGGEGYGNEWVDYEAFEPRVTPNHPLEESVGNVGSFDAGPVHRKPNSWWSAEGMAENTIPGGFLYNAPGEEESAPILSGMAQAYVNTQRHLQDPHYDTTAKEDLANIGNLNIPVVSEVADVGNLGWMAKDFIGDPSPETAAAMAMAPFVGMARGKHITPKIWEPKNVMDAKGVQKYNPNGSPATNYEFDHSFIGKGQGAAIHGKGQYILQSDILRDSYKTSFDNYDEVTERTPKPEFAYKGSPVQLDIPIGTPELTAMQVLDNPLTASTADLKKIMDNRLSRFFSTNPSISDHNVIDREVGYGVEYIQGQIGERVSDINLDSMRMSDAGNDKEELAHLAKQYGATSPTVASINTAMKTNIDYLNKMHDEIGSIQFADYTLNQPYELQFEGAKLKYDKDAPINSSYVVNGPDELTADTVKSFIKTKVGLAVAQNPTMSQTNVEKAVVSAQTDIQNAILAKKDALHNKINSGSYSEQDVKTMYSEIGHLIDVNVDSAIRSDSFKMHQNMQPVYKYKGNTIEFNGTGTTSLSGNMAGVRGDVFDQLMTATREHEKQFSTMGFNTHVTSAMFDLRDKFRNKVDNTVATRNTIDYAAKANNPKLEQDRYDGIGYSYAAQYPNLFPDYSRQTSFTKDEVSQMNDEVGSYFQEMSDELATFDEHDFKITQQGKAEADIFETYHPDQAVNQMLNQNLTMAEQNPHIIDLIAADPPAIGTPSALIGAKTAGKPVTLEQMLTDPTTFDDTHALMMRNYEDLYNSYISDDGKLTIPTEDVLDATIEHTITELEHTIADAQRIVDDTMNNNPSPTEKQILLVENTERNIRREKAQLDDITNTAASDYVFDIPSEEHRMIDPIGGNTELTTNMGLKSKDIFDDDNGELLTTPFDYYVTKPILDRYALIAGDKGATRVEKRQSLQSAFEGVKNDLSRRARIQSTQYGDKDVATELKGYVTDMENMDVFKEFSIPGGDQPLITDAEGNSAESITPRSFESYRGYDDYAKVQIMNSFEQNYNSQLNHDVQFGGDTSTIDKKETLKEAIDFAADMTSMRANEITDELNDIDTTDPSMYDEVQELVNEQNDLQQQLNAYRAINADDFNFPDELPISDKVTPELVLAKYGNKSGNKFREALNQFFGGEDFTGEGPYETMKYLDRIGIPGTKVYEGGLNKGYGDYDLSTGDEAPSVFVIHNPDAAYHYSFEDNEPFDVERYNRMQAQEEAHSKMIDEYGWAPWNRYKEQ